MNWSAICAPAYISAPGMRRRGKQRRNRRKAYRRVNLKLEDRNPQCMMCVMCEADETTNRIDPPIGGGTFEGRRDVF